MWFHLKPWLGVLLWLALGICVLLPGCAGAPPTERAPSPVAAPTTKATATTATVDASTLVVTLVPSRTPTATPTSSPTTTPTPSPTSTATPTWTPIPTLTPTLQPGGQLERALHHQTNGNYVQAIAAYQDLLASDMAASDEALQARYHLAESYLLNREYVAAAAAWEDYIARLGAVHEYPDDNLLPNIRTRSAATLMAARAYHAAGVCARAIAHYQDYLTQETVLTDMVYEWIGDCNAADQELEGAIAAYRQALAAASDQGVRVRLREKVAAAYLALGDNDAAVAEYDAILSLARTDTYRAKIEYLAGQALATSGHTEAAYARYHRAVDNYPKAEYAYLSLAELVEAGVEVDEFQRGLIDYYAGQTYPDALGASVRAFDRYLAVQPAGKAGEALYRKALAQRGLDQHGAALETLQVLIDGYPQSEWVTRAWFKKGDTLAQVGSKDRAVETYRELAALFPADELAPKALWQAAKIREGEGSYLAAAKLHEVIQASFPAFEDADEALWRAGLAHYRAGDLRSATINWQLLLDKYPKSSYRATSLYWLGKLGATPESQEEGEYWDQLVALSPADYYALRVQQIRAGESLTATRLITSAVDSPAWDPAQVETEVLPWLSGWTQVPTDTNLVALPGNFVSRRDIRRGQALLAIGLRREALNAFDSARAATWSDPLTLAQLAFFFRDQGFHGLAARAALRLAGLWPGGSLDDAPLAVQRLAYPLAYTDLLSAEAQTRDLDPLLLAGLVRQESLFEPVATSWVGARGLGQVMPATGEGLARSLGMDGFTLADLYRPSVSIRFGAYYLAIQMNRFDDQILVALAAYNGGPGNTLRWLEAAGDDVPIDLDLFVESITSSQSRRYLRRVYETYLIYERLYRSVETGE